MNRQMVVNGYDIAGHVVLAIEKEALSSRTLSLTLVQGMAHRAVQCEYGAVVAEAVQDRLADRLLQRWRKAGLVVKGAHRTWIVREPAAPEPDGSAAA